MAEARYLLGVSSAVVITYSHDGANGFHLLSLVRDNFKAEWFRNKWSEL